MTAGPLPAELSGAGPAGVYVSLLGRPRLRLAAATEEARWLPFQPDMRFQLLAYLAARGGWVGRDQLAFLFWPDTDSGAARKNLSQLLRRLGRLSWLERLTPALERDPHQLRWSVATDVARFRQATAAGAWQDALALYGGAFLDGFGRELTPEYDAWLEQEREQLHGLRREAAFRAAEAARAAGRNREAVTVLRGLLEHDPFDEEALRALLVAAARAGDRQQALADYQAFAAALAAELGLEPAQATRELIAGIEAGAEVAAVTEPATRVAPSERTTVLTGARPLSTPLPAPLPTDATSFVGRDLELADIAHRLSQGGCRLLTVSGPGGVGKSRLALQSARELRGSYPDGVFFVALEALEGAAQVAGAVAAALGLEPPPAGEPLSQVTGFLAERRCLLVLDNFEHLLDAAETVATLLRQCPQVALLVTSRERLNLDEEWVLPLGGLAYPTDATLPADDLGRYDAVQLFVERARRLRPAFDLGTLSADERTALLELCELVQGLPLALELAAAWARTLSCRELVAEVQRDLDLLTTRIRNVPARHQSLRAAFAHSWRLLTPAERAVYRRLAVFRGGFDRAAAAVVADASLAVLAALLDKSLLRAPAAARFDLHPLLHQYAAEQLAEEGEREATRERHARYYLGWMQQHQSALGGSLAEQRQALEQVVTERENLREAWRTATERGWWQRLTDALEPLERFLQRRGNLLELEQLFAVAAEGFAARPGHEAVVGLMLAKRGWYLQRLGRYELAAELSARAEALLRPRGPSVGLGQALNNLGFIALMKDRHREARRTLVAARKVANAVGNPWYMAGFTNNLAVAELGLGNLARAETLFAEALTHNRQLNDLAEIAINLLNYGLLLRARGDRERAHTTLAEGLEVAREIGFNAVQPYYLMNLGLLHFEGGDSHAAKAYMIEALERAWTIRDNPLTLQALIGLAQLRRAEGDPAEAVRLLACALAQAETTSSARATVKAELQALQEELEAAGHAATFAAAAARGRAQDLGEVVAELLRGV